MFLRIVHPSLDSSSPRHPVPVLFIPSSPRMRAWAPGGLRRRIGRQRRRNPAGRRHRAVRCAGVQDAPRLAAGRKSWAPGPGVPGLRRGPVRSGRGSKIRLGASPAVANRRAAPAAQPQRCCCRALQPRSLPARSRSGLLLQHSEPANRSRGGGVTCRGVSLVEVG